MKRTVSASAVAKVLDDVLDYKQIDSPEGYEKFTFVHPWSRRDGGVVAEKIIIED